VSLCEVEHSRQQHDGTQATMPPRPTDLNCKQLLPIVSEGWPIPPAAHAHPARQSGVSTTTLLSGALSGAVIVSVDATRERPLFRTACMP